MEVTARAPGKIILAGEHAVVHGSTAVATSIDLYTYVSLSFPADSDNDDKLKLHMKDIDLEFSWPIGRVKEALSKLGSQIPSSPASCSPEAIKSIAPLVDKQIPEAKITLASGVSAFLWLYTSIRGYKSGKVVITSEFPLGSGLGSSAALCVSLSAALLALSDSVNLDYCHQGWLMFGENELELVNKWAFEGEKIIHGKPSGLDNTVSTYGNMIKFRSGELTRLKSNRPLRMLITNTKVGRNTKALVASVSERTVRHPIAMGAVFKAVDSISNEVATIIQSTSHDDSTVSEKEDKLGELMEMNQGLLQCMGVSHASIETVLRTTLKYKLATKLTGAGGGGCVLTLIPTFQSETVVDEVTAELEACGFQCLIAGIGGKGLQVSFNSSS
ncbi:Mevalonate kinase [Actinidia chinensis var. chinensis]|uniref:Mevalonate kinase n=1 Tax=Actinidia chinensis var. chinensis TaxID=1590841 RepID=A0A2R6QL91_ACTCC|nr:Mevalonate kinase [Actinidia chinensis var. chinensis]